MSFKEFTRELGGERVEGELIKTVFYSLLTSIVILGVLYYFKLRNIDNFIPKYGFFLLLSIISYAIMLPAIRQVRAYKQFACMSGMMIGMTLGMLAGFLPAMYVGATNGMFVGSVFGMVIGITFGIWNGKCCGVMGLMEGVMAGLMGGLMGGMTAIMLLNDHLKAASIIVLIIGAFIALGLNYMIFGETRESERQRKEDHMFTIIITLILTAATTWLIVFGPRSALFGG